MCTVGGGPSGDLDFDDRVKAKKYRCNECEETFSHVNPKKKPDLSQLRLGQCQRSMIYPLEGEFLLIRGTHSFLLVAQARCPFCPLYRNCRRRNSARPLDPDDLVAASAPEGGALEPAIMLIEFVRKYRMPLMVLPRDHPGSKRFSYLVSAGPEIHTSCSIRRGTHPEQHLICSQRRTGRYRAGRDIRAVWRYPAFPEGASVHG